MVTFLIMKWAPKPRSKHNYCSVCRENYEDYLAVKNLNIKAY